MRKRNLLAELVTTFLWSLVIHIAAPIGLAIGQLVVRNARVAISYVWNALKPQPRRVFAFVRR